MIKTNKIQLTQKWITKVKTSTCIEIYSKKKKKTNASQQKEKINNKSKEPTKQRIINTVFQSGFWEKDIPVKTAALKEHHRLQLFKNSETDGTREILEKNAKSFHIERDTRKNEYHGNKNKKKEANKKEESWWTRKKNRLNTSKSCHWTRFLCQEHKPNADRPAEKGLSHEAAKPLLRGEHESQIHLLEAAARAIGQRQLSGKRAERGLGTKERWGDCSMTVQPSCRGLQGTHMLVFSEGGVFGPLTSEGPWADTHTGPVTSVVVPTILNRHQFRAGHSWFQVSETQPWRISCLGY